MEDFRVYSPEDTVAANLHRTSERFDFLSEQEIAHLRELAYQIVSDSPPEELLASLPDHSPPQFPVSGETLTESRGMLSAWHGISHAKRALLLCREIRVLINQSHPLPLGAFFPDGDVQPHQLSRRIVYQRSGYTDSAYLALSPLVEDARASYTHSFLSACEEVYNGLCYACILPLENSTDGRLHSFSRLIAQYDLKIAATCVLSGGAAGRSTRFALLRRSLLPTLSCKSAPMCFECTIPPGDGPAPSELFTAATLCGLRPLRVDTVPDPEHLAESSLHIAFDPANGDLEIFLYYLAMQAPHYIPVGLYPQLLPNDT